MMKSKTFRVAVVGAGGLVGRKMVQVLEERNFPVSELRLFATAKSAGETVCFRGKDYKIEVTDTEAFKDIDIALFSAGGTPSSKLAPIAAKAGCVVIDNSSFWRRHEQVPLVVPEINPEACRNHRGIIANPNCSTIQLVVAMKPIDDRYGIKSATVSTYQSISGAGKSGLNKLETEQGGGNLGDKHKIYRNAIFHSVDPEYTDMTNEEVKMIFETRKILNRPDIKVAVTCVRLPIIGGHSESVNLELAKEFEIADIRKALEDFGVIVMDDLQQEVYPTAAIANDTDPVYVGRLRRDETRDNGLAMWVVSDNVRKGAATNAVQIAEIVARENLLEYEKYEF